MNEFIIYIIIGIIAYLLLKKKSNNIESSKEEIGDESKKNYEVLYNPEKTRSYQKKGSIPDERKLLYKKAKFKIPKYKHSYIKDYSNIPGARTVNYVINNNKTKIDLLVKDLHREIESTNKGLLGPTKVGGLTGLSLKSRAEIYIKDENDAKFIRDQDKSYSKYVIKPYLINLKPNTTKWGIGSYFKKYENKEERFETFNEFRENIVRPLEKKVQEEFTNLFKRHSYKDYFKLTLSPGNGGKSLWIRIYLKISSKDFVIHNSSVLTEVGKKNLNDIAKEVDIFLRDKKLSLINAYDDKHFRSSLLFLAENNYRKKNGIPLIGDGWIKQAELREGIKEFIANVKNEYSPRWLGAKRIDIYIPSHKVAIEYHGAQHYEAVDFFGGQEAFEKRVIDDKNKKDLCLKNNLSFIEWPHLIEINAKNISKMVDHIELNKGKKYFLNISNLI